MAIVTKNSINAKKYVSKKITLKNVRIKATRRSRSIESLFVSRIGKKEIILKSNERNLSKKIRKTSSALK